MLPTRSPTNRMLTSLGWADSAPVFGGVLVAAPSVPCVASGSGQALDHFDQLTVSSRNRRPSITPDWRTAQS